MASNEPIGTLTGPYLRLSCPYSVPLPSFIRNQWFLSTQTGIYEIIQFHKQPKRFLLTQSHPTIERKTLKGLCKFLLKQEKRIVLCS